MREREVARCSRRDRLDVREVTDRGRADAARRNIAKAVRGGGRSVTGQGALSCCPRCINRRVTSARRLPVVMMIRSAVQQWIQRLREHDLSRFVLDEGL